MPPDATRPPAAGQDADAPAQPSLEGQVQSLTRHVARLNRLVKGTLVQASLPAGDAGEPDGRTPPSEAHPRVPERRRWPLRSGPLLFLAIVVAPWLAFAAYVLLVASPRFETTARLALRSTQPSAAPTGALPLLAGLALGNDQQDSQRLLTWLQSSDLAERLNGEISLKAHFQQPAADWWNRLPADADREDYLREYAHRLAATFEPDSNTVVLHMQTYDPAYGVTVMQHIIAAAEETLNRTTQALARQRLAFLQGQLGSAQDRLAECRRAVLAFQSEHGIPDPVSTGTSSMGRISALEAELTVARTELRTLRGYLSQTAAEVLTAQARIEALTAQLAEEKAGAVGAGKEAVAPLLARFADLLIAQEFAQEAYRTLLAATEQARVEAQQASITLVALEHPAAAESPAYPRHLYSLATAALLLAAAWIVVHLSLTTIREHQDA